MKPGWLHRHQDGMILHRPTADATPREIGAVPKVIGQIIHLTDDGQDIRSEYLVLGKRQRRPRILTEDELDRGTWAAKVGARRPTGNDERHAFARLIREAGEKAPPLYARTYYNDAGDLILPDGHAQNHGYRTLRGSEDDARAAWREIGTWMARDGKAALVAGAFFAGPVLDSLDMLAHMVSVYGAGQLGKSTILTVCAASVGDIKPRGQQLMMAWNSSKQGHTQGLRQRGFLPVAFDEHSSSGRSIRESSREISQMVAGAIRAMGTADGSPREPDGFWHSCILSSSNEPLKFDGQTEDLASRLQEFECPFFPNVMVTRDGTEVEPGHPRAEHLSKRLKRLAKDHGGWPMEWAAGAGAYRAENLDRLRQLHMELCAKYRQAQGGIAATIAELHMAWVVGAHMLGSAIGVPELGAVAEAAAAARLADAIEIAAEANTPDHEKLWNELDALRIEAAAFPEMERLAVVAAESARPPKGFQRSELGEWWVTDPHVRAAAADAGIDNLTAALRELHRLGVHVRGAGRHAQRQTPRELVRDAELPRRMHCFNLRKAAEVFAPDDPPTGPDQPEFPCAPTPTEGGVGAGVGAENDPLTCGAPTAPTAPTLFREDSRTRESAAPEGASPTWSTSLTGSATDGRPPSAADTPPAPACSTGPGRPARATAPAGGTAPSCGPAPSTSPPITGQCTDTTTDAPPSRSAAPRSLPGGTPENRPLSSSSATAGTASTAPSGAASSNPCGPTSADSSSTADRDATAGARVPSNASPSGLSPRADSEGQAVLDAGPVGEIRPLGVGYDSAGRPVDWPSCRGCGNPTPFADDAGPVHPNPACWRGELADANSTAAGNSTASPPESAESAPEWPEVPQPDAPDIGVPAPRSAPDRGAETAAPVRRHVVGAVTASGLWVSGEDAPRPVDGPPANRAAVVERAFAAGIDRIHVYPDATAGADLPEWIAAEDDVRHPWADLSGTPFTTAPDLPDDQLRPYSVVRRRADGRSVIVTMVRLDPAWEGIPTEELPAPADLIAGHLTFRRQFKTWWFVSKQHMFRMLLGRAIDRTQYADRVQPVDAITRMEIPVIGANETTMFAKGSRALSGDEDGMIFLAGLDRTAAYPAAMAQTLLGIGEPRHITGSFWFNPDTHGRMSGYVRMTNDVHIDPHIDEMLRLDAGWLTTGQARMLTRGIKNPNGPDLAPLCKLEIAEAWLWDESESVELFRGFGKEIREARAAFVAGRDEPGGAVALHLLKQMASAFGALSFGIGGGPAEHRERGRLWRPDWAEQIRGQAQANMLAEVVRAGKTRNRWPVAVNVDEWVYATNHLDPAKLAEELGFKYDAAGVKGGHWRQKDRPTALPEIRQWCGELKFWNRLHAARQKGGK